MVDMSGSSNSNVQEFSIRVPKHVPKKHHVMRFNANLGIDFSKWTQVKMERENNMKEYKGIEEDQPRFGAGSEFGREAKEEARRKKLGIITRKYKPEDQPWILKLYSGGVKKFKGIREGGVSENAAYYVFTHAADGAIEAFPLYEWYKFQPIQRYKALSAEEAEHEFSKRNKHLNYFSLMLRKRLRGDEDGFEEEEKVGKLKKGKSKELKISEMDEWMDSSDDDSSDNDVAEDEEDKKEKKKKKQKTAPKKKKRDTDLEAVEDSDDGDDEGRELDYISDSSASEPEDTKLEGVSEEKALRKLLNSDEEDSDEEDKSEKEDGKDADDDKEKDGDKKEDGEEKEKSKKSKKKVKKEAPKKEKKDGGTSDEFSSDSSTDEDIKKQKAEKKAKKVDAEKEKAKEKDILDNENLLSDSLLSDNKRSLSPVGSNSSMPPSKKAKLENPLPNYIPGASESGITEEAVRKYLMRKPMTTTELLQKFKSKKTGLTSKELVMIMTQILKKINPVKQTLKGKMYLFIKS